MFSGALEIPFSFFDLLGRRLQLILSPSIPLQRQRLEDEYNSDVIITAPSVPYKSEFVANRRLVDATFPDYSTSRFLSVVYVNGTETIVSNPADFPDIIGPSIGAIYAPMMIATILVPEGSSSFLLRPLLLFFSSSFPLLTSLSLLSLLSPLSRLHRSHDGTLRLSSRNPGLLHLPRRNSHRI